MDRNFNVIAGCKRPHFNAVLPAVQDVHERRRQLSATDIRHRVTVRDDFRAGAQTFRVGDYMFTRQGGGMITASDADQHAFMTAQTALVKQRVYQIRYPDVDFSRIVPVDFEGSGWESEIQHFSQDFVGKFEPISPQTTTLPLVQTTRATHLVKVATYGAAMRFNLTEVMQAMMIPGYNLRQQQEMALRRAHDQTHWDLVLKGRTDLGWNGLINSDSIVTSVDSPANGTGNSRRWAAKSAENILLDINNLLQGVYVDSNTVEMADTLALPPNVWAALASRFISGTSESVARWIMNNNVYTMKSGMPLNIIEIRGLENAATGNTGRAIAYRMAPDVLRYHLLMPLNIFDPQYLNFDWNIPAMSRTGGLEILLTQAVRYFDQITD